MILVHNDHLSKWGLYIISHKGDQKYLLWHLTTNRDFLSFYYSNSLVQYMHNACKSGTRECSVAATKLLDNLLLKPNRTFSIVIIKIQQLNWFLIVANECWNLHFSCGENISSNFKAKVFSQKNSNRTNRNIIEGHFLTTQRKVSEQS